MTVTVNHDPRMASPMESNNVPSEQTYKQGFFGTAYRSANSCNVVPLIEVDS